MVLRGCWRLLKVDLALAIEESMAAASPDIATTKLFIELLRLLFIIALEVQPMVLLALFPSIAAIPSTRVLKDCTARGFFHFLPGHAFVTYGYVFLKELLEQLVFILPELASHEAQMRLCAHLRLLW